MGGGAPKKKNYFDDIDKIFFKAQPRKVKKNNYEIVLLF